MIQEIQDQKQWNNFLLGQPTQSGIFLQSWEWGEFQAAMGRPAQISASQKFQSGRRVYRYQAHDGFAQVVELPLPFGKKYWYIPRGTLIDGLKEEAQKHGALFVRCEPSTGVLQEVTGGYKKLQEVAPIHPKQTLILDLTKSEEELLTGMHEKTRYNIRLALRRGVEIRNPKSEIRNEFGEFWKLLQETAKRDGFRTHEREYYEKMLGVCHHDLPPPLTPPLAGGEKSISSPFQGEVRRGLALRNDKFFVRFHATYHGSVMLAGAIVAYFGDTATYLHGASSYEHRALMGPYALHWEIMREAKRAGYKFYDFWGVCVSDKAIKRLGDEDNWSGMTRFKMGFATNQNINNLAIEQFNNGIIITYPGTFDLPINRLWYAVYRLGRFCKI